ncbi:MAG: hypothetical protein IPL61_09025 [Myxococcales bacterium]|nr:hypothetical protein [Myxococcales bacterium]
MASDQPPDDPPGPPARLGAPAPTGAQSSGSVDVAAQSSGSIDVAVDVAAPSSGAIDVAIDGAVGAVAAAADVSGPTADAILVAVGASGQASGQASGRAAGRRRRATTASVITDRVVQAADRVAELTDRVGGKIGDVVGESLTILPGVPRTRRGRVLARGVVVGFCLVFAWISVIVGLQLRGRHPPDFRPNAERIFVQLRDGAFEEVYDASSERFQEIVLEDTFVAKMTDLNQSLGRFREVTSVISTETNRGPGGQTGRVDVRLAFDRAATRGSVSFRREAGAWKLLGLSVEVPPELAKVVGSAEARRDRVEGNRIELRGLVNDVITRSFDGDVDAVYQDAAEGFRESITLEDFQRTERERHAALGAFVRVLDVTWARISPNKTSTSVDCLIEFKNYTVKGSFKFVKIDGVWRLALYTLKMPLPRVPG